MELYATEGPNSAGEIARRAVHSGCDLILAAGGDGTINETLNGIAGTQTVFGVLPAGTANVLANEIGLAGTPDRAARQLLDAVPVRIALGRLERGEAPPRYFILMAGVGLDAKIVYELDVPLKRKIGKLAYWHGGFRQVGQPVPRFRTVVNGREYHSSFALVTRVRNYGGDFEIARNVRLTDDDFEVVIFQNREWKDYLRFFGAIVAKRLHKAEGVAIERSSRVEVTAPEDNRIYIQCDGESLGAAPATITTVPDALTILLPQKYLNSRS